MAATSSSGAGMTKSRLAATSATGAVKTEVGQEEEGLGFEGLGAGAGKICFDNIEVLDLTSRTHAS